MTVLILWLRVRDAVTLVLEGLAFAMFLAGMYVAMIVLVAGMNLL
jgi:hypothetical protein